MKEKKEIVWIYESPDNGKTIYRRPFGKLKPRELVKKPNDIKILLKNINPN